MAERKFTIKYPSKEVEDLLLWANPVKSGGVVGAATVVYLLFDWSGYTMVALLCNLLMLAVVGCFLWQHGSSLVGRPGPPIPTALIEGFSQDQFRDLAEKFRVEVNKVLAIAGRLVSGKDLPLTMKVAGGLYGIGWISQRFSLFGLLYTAVVFAFTLPKVYEVKHVDIDKVVNTIQEKLEQVYKQINDAVIKKIPKAKKEQ